MGDKADFLRMVEAYNAKSKAAGGRGVCVICDAADISVLAKAAGKETKVEFDDAVADKVTADVIMGQTRGGIKAKPGRPPKSAGAKKKTVADAAKKGIVKNIDVQDKRVLFSDGMLDVRFRLSDFGTASDDVTADQLDYCAEKGVVSEKDYYDSNLSMKILETNAAGKPSVVLVYYIGDDRRKAYVERTKISESGNFSEMLYLKDIMDARELMHTVKSKWFYRDRKTRIRISFDGGMRAKTIEVNNTEFMADAKTGRIKAAKKYMGEDEVRKINALKKDATRILDEVRAAMRAEMAAATK